MALLLGNGTPSGVNIAGRYFPKQEQSSPHAQLVTPHFSVNLHAGRTFVGSFDRGLLMSLMPDPSAINLPDEPIGR